MEYAGRSGDDQRGCHDTLMQRSLFTCVFFLIASCGLCARTHGGRFTEERLQNAWQNVAQYKWARQQRDKATAAAKAWLSKSDEQLWRLIPGQSLPRTIDVTWDYNHPEKPRLGCLNCRDKIFNHGNYPYKPDIWKAPWKLKCPSCGEVFPKNDFAKYYQSGINEQGLFDPAKADRALLYNKEHPDPNDPLHKFGVDDGYGYVDEAGRAHKFIGYYTWKMWNEICAGVSALSDAYVYTGNKECARKAAIMLDRIADVYPEMDWNAYGKLGWYHSDGGSRKGKIGGRIWETWILANFARDYDRILGGTNDNEKLFRFLESKAREFKFPTEKGTRDAFVQNVDDGILRVGAAGVKSGQILGNDGMRQHAIINCAIALDSTTETKEWIDWVFSERGGELPEILMGGLDRDGTGNEGAPNYSLLWIDKVLAIGELLRDYPKAGRNLYEEFPRLRASFTAGWRMLSLGLTTPNIGDSGATGLITKTQCDAQFIARGYRAYRDPEIARSAYEANGNSAKDLLVDIFSADPYALNRELEKAAKTVKPRATGSANMTGFGLAKLEFGKGKTGNGLWCYYGRNGGHGHRDQLNFSLLSRGVDLTPDHGYPEFATPAWPNRVGWTATTLSHNTVVVDKTPQAVSWDGQPRFFKSLDGFGAFELASKNSYPQTEEYARTMMFVEAPKGNAYALDIFRVRGGNDHVLSFHGPPGPVTAPGLNLEKQTTGTYAGEDISFGEAGTSIPLGYAYLYNVERDVQPPNAFTLDWKAEPGYRGVTKKDDLHLRWHVLSQANDIALADGDPPQNKEYNPRRMRYALLHRAGENVESTYVSLLEPYKAKPFIKSVTRLKTADEVAAVRVELLDGTVDYLLSSPTEDEVRVEPGISFAARAAFLRVKKGKVINAKMIDGSRLEYQSVKLRGTPSYTGTVVEMEKDPRKPASVLVQSDIPSTATLTGEHIIFANDGERNACYRISSVAAEGNTSKISCGPVSFVRGFIDRRDYSKGYVYEFDEGTSFTIPTHVEWKR